MPRRVHAPRVNVEAAVAAVVARVADEDASGGAWSEFVRRRRRKVGVAQTTEDTQFAVVWWNAEQELEWRRGAGGAARPPIDEVGGGDEGLRPEGRSCCTVN